MTKADPRKRLLVSNDESGGPVMLEAIGGFLADLFRPSNPLWLYYPLCAVVAVVYKATKFDEPRKIALAALHFFASVTGGMLVLGVVFYVLSLIF